MVFLDKLLAQVYDYDIEACSVNRFFDPRK